MFHNALDVPRNSGMVQNSCKAVNVSRTPREEILVRQERHTADPGVLPDMWRTPAGPVRTTPSVLLRPPEREFDEACLARRMVDALRGLFIILRVCQENVRNECLRIAVVERKPGGLDLHHHAVARKKDVVRGGQGPAIKQGFIRCNGFGRL